MIIREVENPAFMKECYERNPQAVSRGERKAFEEALKRFLEEEPQNPDLSRIRKAIAVILFFAHRIPGLSSKKAYALLWYADMLHYKEFGASITGLRYEKRLLGPVPENADFLLRAARTQGAIRIEEEPHPFLAYSQPQTMAAFLTQKTVEDFLEDLSESSQTKIYPKKDVDTSCFSPSELRVLHFLVRELGECRAGALTERIRQEKAFRETENLAFIPYHLARFLTLDLPQEE
ncbi:MAG: SocA family protein [Candidatus Atribacteria bacterium]|nr:SocA family protein [Candidatus Atribacteria bacterium]